MCPAANPFPGPAFGEGKCTPRLALAPLCQGLFSVEKVPIGGHFASSQPKASLGSPQPHPLPRFPPPRCGGRAQGRCTCSPLPCLAPALQLGFAWCRKKTPTGVLSVPL